MGPVAAFPPWREARLVVTAARQAQAEIPTCKAKEEEEAVEVAVEREE